MRSPSRRSERGAARLRRAAQTRWGDRVERTQDAVELWSTQTAEQALMRPAAGSQQKILVAGGGDSALCSWSSTLLRSQQHRLSGQPQTRGKPVKSVRACSAEHRTGKDWQSCVCKGSRFPCVNEPLRPHVLIGTFFVPRLVAGKRHRPAYGISLSFPFSSRPFPEHLMRRQSLIPSVLS